MKINIGTLISETWLIEQNALNNIITIGTTFLSSGMKFNPELLNIEDKKVGVFNPSADASAMISTVSYNYELSDLSIPDNSVAVIQIKGVLFDEYYNYIQQKLMLAEDNPRISSILFIIDTVGGSLGGLDATYKVIKATKKPTTAVITGILASAGMWIASGIDDVFASSRMNQVGSIGIKTSFTSYDRFLREKGIDIFDIYASKSTHKDLETKELLKEKSNAKPIIENLDFLNDIFHEVVASARGIDRNSEVFNGSIYFSEEAKKLQLIDDIVPLEEALQIAYTKGLVYRLA